MRYESYGRDDSTGLSEEDVSRELMYQQSNADEDPGESSSDLPSIYIGRIGRHQRLDDSALK